MARTRGAKQLSLPFPKPTAAERKAMIRDRLHGYELRQAFREAKRRASAQRRAAKLAGELEELPHPSQLSLNA